MPSSFLEQLVQAEAVKWAESLVARSPRLAAQILIGRETANTQYFSPLFRARLNALDALIAAGR